MTRGVRPPPQLLQKHKYKMKVLLILNLIKAAHQGHLSHKFQLSSSLIIKLRTPGPQPQTKARFRRLIKTEYKVKNLQPLWKKWSVN